MSFKKADSDLEVGLDNKKTVATSAREIISMDATLLSLHNDKDLFLQFKSLCYKRECTEHEFVKYQCIFKQIC